MLRNTLLLLSVLAACPLCVQAQVVPVLSVQFEGNASVDSARLKTQLRACREGGWYHPEALASDVKRLETYYQDSGYLRAKVGPPAVDLQTIPGKGQMAAIRMPISEGPRYTVGEIAVRNANVLKVTSLLQMAPLRTGQPYSRARMNDWLRKIAESYQSMGYVRFEASIQENVHDVRRVVDCVLECKEGREYRVGRIVVSGDASINPLEFKRRLLVGEGGVYNPEMVTLSLHFINDLRLYQPLSQSEVEVKIDDAANTVDLIFHVIPLKKPTSSLE